MYLGKTVENRCGHKEVSPKKAEQKTPNIGAIIIRAKKVAKLEELIRLFKTRLFIDYHPTLSIIFCAKGASSAILIIGS